MKHLSIKIDDELTIMISGVSEERLTAHLALILKAYIADEGFSNYIVSFDEDFE